MTRLRAIMVCYNLALYNTFEQLPPTYYGAHSSSTIDFIGGPAELREGTKVMVHLGLARRFQVIPSHRLRDHAPLSAEVEAKHSFYTNAEHISWEHDLLTAGARRGLHREAFVLDVEVKLRDIGGPEWQALFRQETPTGFFREIVHAVRQSAKRYYGKGRKLYATEYDELRKQREEHLHFRFQIRNGMVDCHTPSMLEIVKRELAAVSRKCTQLRKDFSSKMDHIYASDMQLASQRQDSHRMWGCMYRLAHRSTAPRRRQHNLPRTSNLMLDNGNSDWPNQARRKDYSHMRLTLTMNCKLSMNAYAPITRDARLMQN
jgi:hypothetical protein